MPQPVTSAKAGVNLKNKPVIIDVYSHNDLDPAKQFTLEWRFENETPEPSETITFPKGSGGHNLTFKLHDDARLGVRFKEDWTDAIWAVIGTRCPSEEGDGGGQLTDGSVTGKGTELKLWNANTDACDLCYKLRFDPDPYCFDPIIRNGGGGTGSLNSIAVPLVIGIAVVAAVAFFAFR